MPAESFDWVVPVPMHWTRRWLRGYDQAELLAAALADRLELPFLKALRRTRRTRALASLGPKERAAQLEGAIATRAVLEDKRILLVDDVRTSGATLESCAAALRDGGARQLSCVVVAVTPANLA